MIDNSAVISNDWLSDAWRRSVEYGINPEQLKQVRPIDVHELQERKKKKRLLLDVAGPFINHLYTMVDGEFIVVISDQDAVILKVRGEKLPEELLQIHTTEGMVWTEQEFGANALGTALVLDHPVHMVGAQHYCKAFHGMTCAGSPIHDETGTIIGGIAVAAYKKEHSPYLLGMVMSSAFSIEQAIRLQSENRLFHLIYERIMHTANHLYLLVNERGIIEQMNQAATQFFGLSSGTSLSDVMQENSAPMISFRTKQQLFDVKEEYACANGQLTVSWDAYWIDHPLLKRSFLLLIGRDMTKMVQMQRSVEQLERLSTMGKFSAQMAHEIRNPIATIQLAVQILKKQGVFQGNAEKKAELILAQLRRIGGLTDHFLNISKPAKPELRQYSIQTLLSDTCDLMQSQFIQAEIDLRQSYDARISLQWIDPDQMQQVFINLLNNAIDATPKGGTLSATMALRDNDSYEIIVTDTGHGIPEDKLQEIFEPFYTTKSKGIGLGLCNSKAIIEAHGGQMIVESQDDQGTSVHIMLPILQRP
ncbi:ATP-binding protein [Fodinisporobacter ferrooxydans]|uniref:histidine kinase n=1 Tax=Fodinisporobacter ferrooxydans TaxID=2901836 RepID=A0ABY4CLV6_9BACL|nr:ATP-binding protein [Alicyclobacillaceae bacterium MYW30-H2]